MAAAAREMAKVMAVMMPFMPPSVRRATRSRIETFATNTFEVIMYRHGCALRQRTFAHPGGGGRRGQLRAGGRAPAPDAIDHQPADEAPGGASGPAVVRGVGPEPCAHRLGGAT